MSGSKFGNVIKQSKLDELFLTGPGEDLVPKTLLQLSKIPGMISIFGPYTKENDQQRWADYARFDWSIRQLPAINIFESESETKDSDQAFLRGTIGFQIFWPPSARRGDYRRTEVAFKGIIENFFASDYVQQMLDEIYFVQRDCKVYGLNEYGKTLSWIPNTEGILGDELIPVTILNVQYRIDLRAWYRALEYEYRTKGKPFEVSLSDLYWIGGAAADGHLGVYQGIDANNKINPVQTEVEDEIHVN